MGQSAAARLGIDPLELRRALRDAGRDALRGGGASLNQRTIYDCGDYASALDEALDALGYEAARTEQAAARRQGRYVGIGVACLVEKAGLGPWEYARVEVDATGHVVVYSGVAAVGQGIDTTLAQVCADELNVAPESITVVHGDSARVPFGVGGFASRGASVALPAASAAARKVRDKTSGLPPPRSRRPVTSCSPTRRPFRGLPERRATFRDLLAASLDHREWSPGSTRAISSRRRR